MFRWLNFFMAALFFVAAALQYNDPDPLQWGLMYAAAGASCLFYRRLGRLRRSLPSALAAGALIWAGALFLTFPGRLEPARMFQSMQAERPEIEVTREISGLILVAGWMLALAARPARRAEAGSPDGGERGPAA